MFVFRERLFASDKLTNETEAVYSLSNNSAHRTIFLIGETHLGKSQKAVAKKIVELINTYEIDAIFIEQPETLKFNWSKYETLSNQPDKAIAALQERMIKDADRPMSLDLGKYQVYFDKAKPKTKEEIMAVLEQIYVDYGEEGAKEAISMLNKLPDVSKTNKLYEESKYISAADYLYVMLNLKGIKLPFHNIESDKLRKKFWDSLSTSTPTDDTTKRDRFMVATAEKLIKSKNYRRVILICGAKHLDKLNQMFAEKKYDVKIEYNSLENEFKREITALKNPGVIKDIAKEGPSSGFVPSKELIVEKAVSKQMMDIIDKYLATKATSFYSDSEINNIRAKFIEEYKIKNLKGTPSWTISIKEGKYDINFSKNAIDDSLRINVELPLVERAKQAYDPKLNELAKATNKQILSSPSDTKFSYYIVEQHPSMHMLYDGKGNPLDNFEGSFKISEIFDKISKATPTTDRREVYLALKNYTPEQAEGLAASARIALAKQGKSNIKIRTVLNPESRLTRDFFETPVGIKYISETPVKETKGSLKGWFKAIVDFLTPDNRALRMELYTKTKLQSMELIQRLKSYVIPGSLWNMDVMEGTQAELAVKIRTALETDKDLKHDGLKMIFKDETSEIQVGILIIEDSEEGVDNDT
ncbi:hypothetical protein MBAV_006190 [Candidatus Magnetobacterium bavaricum]|uniref:Uncharacterized protein n=1 Tax=Candidatus Magnetobacterium bavaricum TaxID=29290 RepID=A0A0F3GLP9_9BACT|nr:hypothetical protein MBAV_006190 [Candidatus Magnetobacterium bavaricum]